MPPKKRATWSEQQLQSALDSISEGTPVNRASIFYGIPRRTLRNHIQSGRRQRKLGTRSIFTKDQEDHLCNRIFRLAEVGMPLTPELLRRSVFSYAEEQNLKHNFNRESGMSGRKWMKLFFERHEDLRLRRAQMLNPARAQEVNKFIVNDYFGKLKDVLQKLDLINQPQKIYNMDERGCRLTLHHQQQVLARKGEKRVHLVASEHAENATIVACGNAIGQAIPPMVLFKGKRKKDEWMDNMPPGNQIEMTAKGSMTCDMFVEWIRHFAKFKTDGDVLLIFDGAASHLGTSIVMEADMHHITLLCLPSNTTHELQPLDKSVFRSFEYYWDIEVMSYYTRHPERKITRNRFGEILSRVYPKAMSIENLQSGFRATGIYPFDPDVIPKIAFAPSTLTTRPDLDAGPKSASSSIATPEIDTDRPSTSEVCKETTRINSSYIDSESSSDSDIQLAKLLSISMLKLGSKIQVASVEFRHQSTSPKTQIQNHTEITESWFCFLCQEDKVQDMRLCVICFKYVHEECGGLRKSDREKFICPKCQN